MYVSIYVYVSICPDVLFPVTEKSFAIMCMHNLQVFSESISSVDGGVVGSSMHEEVVVATYSGRVLGLTHEPSVQQTISQETKAKVEVLRYIVGGRGERICDR